MPRGFYACLCCGAGAGGALAGCSSARTLWAFSLLLGTAGLLPPIFAAPWPRWAAMGWGEQPPIVFLCGTVQPPLQGCPLELECPLELDVLLEAC